MELADCIQSYLASLVSPPPVRGALGLSRPQLVRLVVRARAGQRQHVEVGDAHQLVAALLWVDAQEHGQPQDWEELCEAAERLSALPIWVSVLESVAA